MSMLSRFASLGSPSDLYWNNVSFLLVGNGANGTTTNIVDSSKYSRSISIVGNTVISTTQSKYGSGSVYFDGNGDYLTLNGLAFGTGNFTLEFWLNPSTLTNNAYPGVFDCRDSNGNAGFAIHGYNGGLSYTDGGVNLVIPSSQIPLSQFTYFSWCRVSGVVSVYINGVQYGSSVTKTTNYSNTAWRVGAVFDGYAYNGYIYDLRVTNGIARYTSNFTPPTGPLPIG